MSEKNEKDAKDPDPVALAKEHLAWAEWMDAPYEEGSNEPETPIGDEFSENAKTDYLAKAVLSLATELEAYKKAKAENDERFMIASVQAEQKLATLQQLSDANGRRIEALEHLADTYVKALLQEVTRCRNEIDRLRAAAYTTEVT